MPLKTIAGIATGTAMVMGGVDASVLNEVPLERIEIVAENRVEAKQVGNIVETTLPWKDQEGIKVKVDLGEPSVAERMRDKRKKEVITETVTDFEGGFKVDLLLNEKPDTNVFCYAIEGAENYDFFYQPPLTEQEKAEGANRPPEIEGSYAVYHKTLRDHIIGQENYATGKVMHIPRPQVWSLSDESTKVWADMNYSDGQLCVTVPQNFLNGAEYPVRVDPTFGYTSLPTGATLTICNVTSDTSQLLGLAGDTYALGDYANVTSLSVALDVLVAASANTDLYVALYQEDSAGADSHDLVTSGEVLDTAITNVGAFQTVSLTPTSLNPNNVYILSAICNGEDLVSGQVGVLFDSGGGSGRTYNESTTGAGSYATRKAENPWTETDSASTARYGFYATYTTIAQQVQRLNNGTLRINNGTLDL